MRQAYDYWQDQPDSYPVCRRRETYGNRHFPPTCAGGKAVPRLPIPRRRPPPRERGRDSESRVRVVHDSTDPTIRSNSLPARRVRAVGLKMRGNSLPSKYPTDTDRLNQATRYVASARTSRKQLARHFRHSHVGSTPVRGSTRTTTVDWYRLDVRTPTPTPAATAKRKTNTAGAEQVASAATAVVSHQH